MEYSFSGKKCGSIPIPFNLGVKGDFGTTTEVFSFQKTVDGTDLSGCDCYALLSGACVFNGIDSVLLTKEVTDTRIKASWAIDNSTFKKGRGKLQFKFFKQASTANNTPAIAWYSEQFDIEVGDAIFDITAGSEFVLKGSKQSGRVEDGVIYFYEGDSIEFDWTITFDLDGVSYDFVNGDKMTFKFYNESGNLVHEMAYTQFVNNGFTFAINATASKKFTKGRYTYRGTFTKQSDGKQKTIYSDNVMVVE